MHSAVASHVRCPFSLSGPAPALPLWSRVLKCLMRGGVCGIDPLDPLVGSALWRPGHRIMKTKVKKNLGARRQRPDSDPALTAAE
eukprot:scaffold10393_cov114-Isochrysis_galbana.AAC.1